MGPASLCVGGPRDGLDPCCWLLELGLLADDGGLPDDSRRPASKKRAGLRGASMVGENGFGAGGGLGRCWISSSTSETDGAGAASTPKVSIGCCSGRAGEGATGVLERMGSPWNTSTSPSSSTVSNADAVLLFILPFPLPRLGVGFALKGSRWLGVVLLALEGGALAAELPGSDSARRRIERRGSAVSTSTSGCPTRAPSFSASGGRVARGPLETEVERP